MAHAPIKVMPQKSTRSNTRCTGTRAPRNAHVCTGASAALSQPHESTAKVESITKRPYQSTLARFARDRHGVKPHLRVGMKLIGVRVMAVPTCPIQNEKRHHIICHTCAGERRKISAHRLHIMDSRDKVTLFVRPFAHDTHLFSTTP